MPPEPRRAAAKGLWEVGACPSERDANVFKHELTDLQEKLEKLSPEEVS